MRIRRRERDSSFAIRVPVIGQPSFLCSEPVLEEAQSVIFEITTAEIDFPDSPLLALFNEFPEQERHAPKIVEPFVGTSVFIDDLGRMPESHHRGDGLPVFAGEGELQIVAEPIDQVLKPGSRLGKKLMPAPRHEEKLVELIEKLR